MQQISTVQLDADRYQKIPAIESELRQRLPWLWTTAFKIGTNEGYDGERFGARAGPMEAMNCKNVLHEASHLVEMTLLPGRVWKRRVKRPHFEMRIRTFQTIGGERYYEPITMQPSERECRVGGIQLRLLEAGGYDTTNFVGDFALTLKYMADWYMCGDSPLNVHDPAKYTEAHHEWLNTRTALIQAAYDQFPLSDIQRRWDEATGWLESSS